MLRKAVSLSVSLSRTPTNYFTINSLGKLKCEKQNSLPAETMCFGKSLIQMQGRE